MPPAPLQLSEYVVWALMADVSPDSATGATPGGVQGERLLPIEHEVLPSDARPGSVSVATQITQDSSAAAVGAALSSPGPQGSS